MMKIPFYRPSVDQNEIDEVTATLRSGWLTTGARTKQFEADFAAYVRQPHAVALNSCTAALHLALEALGIQSGDGVLVPTMTFAATAEVVRYLGAVPILVDCRESDFNLDVQDAEARLRDAMERGINVKAIMPVHYAGQIGDVAGVRRLAQQYGLKVVDDAAHCCPAYHRDPGAAGLPMASDGVHTPAQWFEAGWQPVGNTADISCFSFYANKCITTGEGGMACTANAEYADRMRIMSLHGISRDAWKRYMGEGSWYYEIIAPGYKYNMTDVAAAMGLHQLRKSDRFHKRRSEIAAIYHERLGGLPQLELPRVQNDRVHSWHLFCIRLNLDQLSINRADFITELSKTGVSTSVHYTPLHLHPYYREKFGYKPEDLPCMTGVYPRIFTLPLFPDLKAEEIDLICRNVEQLVLRHRR